MSPPIYKTVREMVVDLTAKRISARELLEAHLARNGQLTRRLNSVIETDIEQARMAAQAIDDARAKGEARGALAGIPMTIKDGFDVAGMPATSGNPAFAHRSKECADADVVASARKEGAVIWGKTNVPFMLGDFQSYNAIYGTTNNPYDLSRTPGGSSGGAAGSLAAGITPLEIGSDIGGSLRHPANFCGVFALKPTWGVLSSRGHVPPPPGTVVELDLGVMGPMARNAGDLRLLWDVLRGRTSGPPRKINGARVALWDEEPGFSLAREIRNQVQRAADALRRAGAIVETARPPIRGEELMTAYLELLTPIMASGFPDNLRASFVARREEDLKIVREGTGQTGAALYRLRATASDGEILAAMARRQALKDRLAQFFASGIDAILCPISPVPAFKHLQEPQQLERTLDVDGETVPYMSMLNWIALATALHGPAMAVPAGQGASGLPIGVQLVGPSHGEDRLFDFASVLEEEMGGFRPPAL